MRLRLFSGLAAAACSLLIMRAPSKACIVVLAAGHVRADVAKICGCACEMTHTPF